MRLEFDTAHDQKSLWPPGKEGFMPLFMDVHNMDGAVSAEDVAKAHQADVETQGKYGVDYKSYWVDEKAGKIFCLVEAPTRRPPTPFTARPTASWPTRSMRSARGADRGPHRHNQSGDEESPTSPATTLMSLSMSLLTRKVSAQSGADVSTAEKARIFEFGQRSWMNLAQRSPSQRGMK